MFSRPNHNALVGAFLLAFTATVVALLLMTTTAVANTRIPSTVSAAPSAEAECASSAVPEAECRALVRLYEATDGANWRNNDGWLDFTDDSAPCHWHGVACENGQVATLALAGNGLRGIVPASICALARADATADLGYNQIQTFRRSTRFCLDALDPDWSHTQTIAPRDLSIETFGTDSLSLTWSPVPYTGDGGSYEVSYAVSARGPYTVHGQTADKSASGYLLDGLRPGQTHYVRVRTHTPAHANQPMDLWSDASQTIGVTRDPDGSILLLFVLFADNDLDVYVEGVVERLRRGTDLNPNVRVALLVDRLGEENTHVLDVFQGTVTGTDWVVKQWGAEELDLTDPAVLAWFLRAARQRWPVERTVVTFVGHGLPLTPEIEWIPSETARQGRTPYGKLPPLPRGQFDTLSDYTDGSYLSVLDLGEALRLATDDGAEPFDVVFFDQCFQGNLDTLYEVRETAEIFVASSNYAWLSAAYDRYLTQFAPAASTDEIAERLLQLYQGTLDNQHPNVIFSVRGDQLPAIAAAVSELGTALLQVVESGDDDAIAAIDTAAVASQYVDTSQCEQPEFTLGQPDELMGIGSFATNLVTAFGDDDAFGVIAAAETVLATLAPVQSSVRIGRPYFAPDSIWAYDDTLTVLAPLARDVSSATAWRTSLYREASGYTATWTLAPTQTMVVRGSLAFVQDGTWDDFLHAWYTEPMTPTIGVWCHYVPPAQVAVDDAEPLTLTVQAGRQRTEALQLTWSESSDERADSYWLFGWGPGDVSWRVLAILPLTQTDYEVSDLEPGVHRFAVLGRDPTGLFVARSNMARWPMVSEPRLFLPAIFD